MFEKRIETLIPMTHLLLALDSHIRVRLLELDAEIESLTSTLASTDLKGRADAMDYCDFDHPSIQRVAGLLRGRDEWESAIRIWEFVRSFPYRLGFWDMKASQTLELGFGMCTTKSNLQIALLRALNIEAKLGKALVKTEYMGSFILPAYLKKIRKKKIKHYFTMARLDGQWFRSDASFSREAIGMLAEKYPRQFSHLVGAKFEKGKDFFVEIEEEMMDTSSKIMRERPFYRHGNIEAMNILLDRRQGLFMPAPPWVRLTLKLLNDDPELAIFRAIAGLMGDTEKLRLAIRERNALYKNHHAPKTDYPSADYPMCEGIG